MSRSQHSKQKSYLSVMSTYLNQSLGNYILEERESIGITQKKLASELKISAQFLGRIEHGAVPIPIPTLIGCIKVLKLKERKVIKIFENAGKDKAKRIFQLARKKTN
ncbi:MAG: helix-turn-helix transcriptional regulator [Bdellovibrionales bacterium]|nr:helix-turn-helix transcriptional regulator [Bdellovibrionales bacterium]